jgi:outer membrane protein
MYQKLRLILITGSVLLSTGIINAQDEWDLQQCVNYALENNISIKQSKINSLYYENLLSQSKSDLLPNLNASAGYGVSFGRALDQTTYEFTQDQTVQSINPQISSSVTLFNGLIQQNTIDQNEFDYLASLEDLEKLKNDVSLNIAGQYLQILLNEELLTVAKEQLEVTAAQVERTKVLVDAGSVARGNLLEIEAQQAADELTVINAENNLAISYLTLSQLLELDSVKGFKIVIPEITTIPEENLLVPVNEIFADALEVMPQINAAEYNLMSSMEGLEIAKGTRYPRLNLTASYGTGYSDIREQVIDVEEQTIPIGTTQSGEQVFATSSFPVYGAYPIGDQFKDNASTSLFLNLSIPIFNNFQVRNNISNAKLAIDNSKLEVENQKNILYREIQQAYADALAALKRYRSSEKALESMQESFKYTREKYEVGLVNAVDFNIAQSQLIFTQSELLQSKYDFLFKTNILNFYRGKPIVIE